VPLYEYQCPKCGRFEVIRKFSDPPLSKCPTCRRAIQKLPSAPAIQFKGAGWYVTDYAKKAGGEGSSGGEPAVAAKGAASDDATNTPGETTAAKPAKTTDKVAKNKAAKSS
jgi:putative FmdB family regulatory protein